MKASLYRKIQLVRSLAPQVPRLFAAASIAVAGAIGLGADGCSTTTKLAPEAPPEKVELPAYAYLPHPSGFAVSDIRVLFTRKEAAQREKLSGCDSEFKTVMTRTQSVDERARAVRELVVKDPVRYHWCFYSRVLDLDDALINEDYVDEKQKRITQTYQFLVPIARAFLQEYQDSRYLRWAIRDYRRLSDAYFYRKLEISPRMSSELVDVGDPFHAFAPGADDSAASSILKKYKVGEVEGESESTTASAEPGASGASEDEIIDINQAIEESSASKNSKARDHRTPAAVPPVPAPPAPVAAPTAPAAPISPPLETAEIPAPELPKQTSPALFQPEPPKRGESIATKPGSTKASIATSVQPSSAQKAETLPPPAPIPAPVQAPVQASAVKLAPQSAKLPPSAVSRAPATAKAKSANTSSSYSAKEPTEPDVEKGMDPETLEYAKGLAKQRRQYNSNTPAPSSDEK